MAIEDLLRYGEWSGPGWTAGMPADFFTSKGVDRKISNADRAVPGIDRYDNFVAKAHDLNEFAAQETLRGELADLGLTTTKTKTVGGRRAFADPLIFGKGGLDLKRFVSYDHYLDQLGGASAPKTKARKLCRAFVMYFMHIAYSNAQFAVDCILNYVDYFGNIGEGSIRMAHQLRIAPHWFLKEASELELKCVNVQTAHGAALIGSKAMRDHLKAEFVSPTASFFKPVDSDGYIAALTRDAMIAADRVELTEIHPVMIGLTNNKSRKQIARMIERRHPEGFTSAAALIKFLER